MHIVDITNATLTMSALEIKNIIYGKYSKEDLIAKYEIECDEDYRQFIEQVYGSYLQSIIRSSTNISWEVVQEMYRLFEALNIETQDLIDSFIGEIARFNLSDIELLEKVKHRVEKDWALDQIHLREKLYQWYITNEDDAKLIDLLTETKYIWPIYQVLPTVSSDSLKILSKTIMDKKLYTKSNRHDALQVIKKELKSRVNK